MKVLAVFALFVAFAAALPAPLPQSNDQSNLLAADTNQHVENANRDKRFIFFSKVIVPYTYTPVTYTKVATPVVTPIVQKTKVVAAAPVVTYQVKPVTYQYTYSIPSYTVTAVKAAPVAVAVEAAPAVATATVTKTASVVTTETESNNENESTSNDEE